jgi:hypothetical protein
VNWFEALAIEIEIVTSYVQLNETEEKYLGHSISKHIIEILRKNVHKQQSKKTY